MDPVSEKRDALAKAQEILAAGDDADLMHAALQLRRCLEAVVYEKLWAYRKRIPADVAKKWQPPQAFRALLILEPNAAQSSALAVAEETTLGGPPATPFRSLGVDLRPKSAWLTKTYNKLGGLLHATWPYAAKQKERDPQDVRVFLKKVVTELEPYVARSFTCTLAVTVDFDCVECGKKIIANVQGVEKAEEVSCLNPDCNAHYFAVKKGDKFEFELDAMQTTCPVCEKALRLPTHLVTRGFEFSCKHCNTEFEITGPDWRFQERHCDPKEDSA